MIALFWGDEASMGWDFKSFCTVQYIENISIRGRLADNNVCEFYPKDDTPCVQI